MLWPSEGQIHIMKRAKIFQRPFHRALSAFLTHYAAGKARYVPEIFLDELKMLTATVVSARKQTMIARTDNATLRNCMDFSLKSLNITIGNCTVGAAFGVKWVIFLEISPLSSVLREVNTTGSARLRWQAFTLDLLRVHLSVGWTKGFSALGNGI